jgi:outer membrane autotransporter protein
MKTKPHKITGRSVRKLFSILAVISIFLGLSEMAKAQQKAPFWDGTDPPNNGVIGGGTGTWNVTTNNWTSSDGLFNDIWQRSDAIFTANAGTVTVNDAVGGGIVFNNMEFAVTGYQIDATTGSSLQLNGIVQIKTDAGVTATISAPLTDPIESSGGFEKIGEGTLILSGTNTYTGSTTVSAGILNIQNGSALGDTFNGTTVSSGATLQLQGGISVGNEFLIISGAGAAGQNGALVNVSGTNNYDGLIILASDSTISSDSGTLNLTNTGTIENPKGFVPSSLTLTGAGDGTITSIIGNDVVSTLTKNGTGTWTLFGLNTYTGATIVDAGTLLVDGSLAPGSAVTVNSGATLGGTGTAAGAVTIADGGILAPGNSPGTPGTFTMGSLSLGNASLLNYDLGTPGVIPSGANDLTNVTGNLVLDGSLNTTALAGFGPGAYRLFNYSGALTDNTLDIGTVPAGFSASDFTIITGLPNEVDLLVLAGPFPPSVQFWDGPNTTPNGVIDGGTGDWDNFRTNWTDASGNNNSSWLNGMAVFAGTAGIVTVTQPIFFAGMEFMTDGYQIDQGAEGSLNLIGSPTITTDAGVTATINATLNGAGGITKEGPGTLILSGENTYLGITTINAGVLSISSDANLGITPGAPVANQLTFNGGTLQGTAIFALDTNRGITLLSGGGTIGVTAANILSYGGVITGAGSLTKTDTGTLVLSGMNTYTGATTVNGGTLAAGAINTLPSQTALAVATGATFDLNNFSQSIGSLAGAGSVTLGTATLTTGNDNTSTDFSGVISGVGGLTKVGAGMQTLSGKNTYAGVTAVNAGSLIVDGSIASAETFVNPGGLLGGNGSLDGNLTNSGIVSPGNSPGKLTVNGNYTQTTNGTLLIEIAGTGTDPRQFDLLAMGGHASLAGTLQLSRLGNFQLQIGDKIIFLTAQDGVSGTFSTIQNPFLSNTLIKVEINILANAVELEGTQGSFTAVACNPNTLAVAKALDSAVGDPRAAALIEFLDAQPLPELCPDLELISPEELAAMFNIGVSLANIQTVNLERRMEDIRAGSSGFSARGFSIDSRVSDFSQGLAGPTGPEGKSGPSVMQPTPENRWGVFATGLGEFTSVDDTSIAPGYNFSTGGLTFGVDYRVSPNFAIGLTGGYAHTNADLVNNGSLDVNGGTIGAYATGFGGGFYFDAAAFGVFNGYDSHRTALLGTASGDTDGQDFNALVVGGYDWKSGGLSIGPLASFQYTYVGLDSFTEHGSLAPLSFSNQNAESTRTALGAKASYDWHVGHVVVKPELRASWQHEFGDTDYSVVSRFANGAGNSFTVNGPAIGRDSLLIGAGAAVMFNDRVSVYAYYDGELARTNYSSNNVSAGLRVNF